MRGTAARYGGGILKLPFLKANLMATLHRAEFGVVLFGARSSMARSLVRPLNRTMCVSVCVRSLNRTVCVFRDCFFLGVCASVGVVGCVYVCVV